MFYGDFSPNKNPEFNAENSFFNDSDSMKTSTPKLQFCNTTSIVFLKCKIMWIFFLDSFSTHSKILSKFTVTD